MLVCIYMSHQEVNKMQERLGEGHLFSPHKFLGYRFGGLHDFAWGMFGRRNMARRVLEGNWAGRLLKLSTCHKSNY